MKRPAIPRKLKMLGRSVDVYLVSDNVLVDAWGDCQAHTQTIRINNALPHIGRAHVLCHEALHLYSDVLGLELPHPMNDSLAYVIMDLIRENPGLVEFISSTKE